MQDIQPQLAFSERGFRKAAEHAALSEADLRNKLARLLGARVDAVLAVPRADFPGEEPLKLRNIFNSSTFGKGQSVSSAIFAP